MSTAFFPTNMRSMPAGGKNNRSTYENIPYVPWKGTGVFSNPVGTAPSHIRPLTNNDTGNVFLSGSFPSRVYANVRNFNPRPLKQYRKGRVVPSVPITGVPDLVAPSPYDKNLTVNIRENDLINYNMNRFVVSSKGQSLGGGAGGSGLLDIQDTPGSYVVNQNPIDEINESIQLNKDCKTCEGVGIVTNYYPNNTYITENPDKNTQNSVWCCNPERTALQRVIPASTILSKKYYTTLQQYRQNRCKTFVQREFNFQQINPANILELTNSNNPFITPKAVATAPPGSPLALLNTYAANCQPNGQIDIATQNYMIVQMISLMVYQNILTQTEVDQINRLEKYSLQKFFHYLKNLPEPTQSLATAVFVGYINYLTFLGIPISGPTNPAQCKAVVYKPNNYQFAKQGAVASSTSTLKLKVDTITTNAASFNNYNANLNTTTVVPEITDGVPPPNPFILKSKVPGCNTPPIYPYQNKKSCYYTKQLPSYQLPVSQPSPYRYYPGTVFTSNHYSSNSLTYLSR